MMIVHGIGGLLLFYVVGSMYDMVGYSRTTLPYPMYDDSRVQHNIRMYRHSIVSTCITGHVSLHICMYITTMYYYSMYRYRYV